MKKLEKILTQSEYSDNALETSIEICKNHLPFMDECKDKRQMVVFTLSDNPKYCVDLVDYYYGNGINEDAVYYTSQFTETLAHDLLGLYKKDEHFVPRINNKTD